MGTWSQKPQNATAAMIDICKLIVLTLRSQPGIRIAPDVVRFGNEAGRQDITTTFDDAGFNDMPPNKFKPYHETEKKCAMSTERWGWAKFAQ